MNRRADFNEKESVKSAGRVLDILELLLEESQGLTVSEISAKLHIPRSSTHGLVHTLLRRSYLNLNHEGEKRFRLGLRLIALGLRVRDEVNLRSVARGPLERLATITGETAFLALPDGGDLAYIDKVVSRAQDMRAQADLRLDVRRPIHCTSLGKAFLAALDDNSVLAIVNKFGMRPATKHSLMSRRRLVQDLADTRKRGYSIDREEAVLGVCCAGAPVRDHVGRPIAAVSVATIREFFEPDRIGPLVRETAVVISRAMGWTGDEKSIYDLLRLRRGPGMTNMLVRISEQHNR